MCKFQKKNVQSLKKWFLRQMSNLDQMHRASQNFKKSQLIKWLMIWQQNINSEVSKFQELKVIGQGILDILIVKEIKLHDSFLVAKFCINGFWILYTLGQNWNGGRIIIYVREDITRKMLIKHMFPDYIEALFIEINFWKRKWLLCWLYHSPTQSEQ